MGVKVRTYVGEGALRWGRAYGYGWAQIRSNVGGGALRRARAYGSEGRKYVGAGAGVWSDGGVRRGVGGRKYALMAAPVRISVGAGA